MRPPDPDSVAAAADRAEKRAGGGPGRQGRGQLSSLDQVPDEGREDVVWARGELAKRQRTQADILFELNERLERKGIDGISRSAFNRHSVAMAAALDQVEKGRRLFEGLAPQFTAEHVDQSTIVIGEFLKLLVFELVQTEGREIGAKGASELARAHLAVIQGQKISADRRRALEAEFTKQAEKAVDVVAHEKGLSGDTVRTIKEKVLGLRLPPPKGAG